MDKLSNAAITLFVAAVLVMAAALGLFFHELEAGRNKATMFDTYTHGILCSSLVVDRTELKHEPAIVADVDQMLKDYCPGFTLP